MNTANVLFNEHRIPGTTFHLMTNGRNPYGIDLGFPQSFTFKPYYRISITESSIHPDWYKPTALGDN